MTQIFVIQLIYKLSICKNVKKINEINEINETKKKKIISNWR